MVSAGTTVFITKAPIFDNAGITYFVMIDPTNLNADISFSLIITANDIMVGNIAMNLSDNFAKKVNARLIILTKPDNAASPPPPKALKNSKAAYLIFSNMCLAASIAGVNL